MLAVCVCLVYVYIDDGEDTLERFFFFFYLLFDGIADTIDSYQFLREKGRVQR